MFSNQCSNSITTPKSEIITARNIAKLNTDIARSKSLCGSSQPCRNKLSVSTFGRNAKDICVLNTESNGNLTILDNRTNQIIWESGSANKGTPPYSTILLENGNLVVQDSLGKYIWESNVKNQKRTNHRQYVVFPFFFVG